MHKIIERIRINAPVEDVYAHCMRFGRFPQFLRHMSGVDALTATRFRWHAAVDGNPLLGECEITAQSPPERIVWRSTSGQRHAGALQLRRISDRLTQVILVMVYDPGTMDGWLAREVTLGLADFKDHVERSITAAASAKNRTAVALQRRARRIAANALSTSRRQWTLPH